MAEMAAQSGRVVAEDGSIVNFADILGGEDTGEKADIEKMQPHSGRFVKEDGSIVNISGNIGGGSGGDVHGMPAGGTEGQILQKKSDAEYDAEWADKPAQETLTLTIGGTEYKYDGSAAVNVAIGAAEGESF